jgi:hypothetical protein
MYTTTVIKGKVFFSKNVASNETRLAPVDDLEHDHAHLHECTCADEWI